MKKYIAPLSVMLVGFTMIILGCITNTPPTKKPVYVEYYLTGDTVNVNGNMLTVKDAKGLNKAMANYEQGLKEYTSLQLDSIHLQYCTK